MKGLTEIIFILDRSGSMVGLESDTIGGFNAMIEKQKREDGEALVSTVLFDDEIQILHDRVLLHCVEPMTEKEYFVRGCTALLDAVGSTIDYISRQHDCAGQNMPQRTLFVITTDGMENASHNYTYRRVKEMIEQKKSSLGWEFLFLGANIDAVETASRFGIDESHAADYLSDTKGTALNYDVLSDAICQIRSCSEPLSADWKKRIDADFNSRKSRE